MNQPINQPKLLSQRIRKRYNKTLGTSVINSLMSPPFKINSGKVAHILLLQLLINQINKNLKSLIILTVEMIYTQTL